jgi:hypothetical protein
MAKVRRGEDPDDPLSIGDLRLVTTGEVLNDLEKLVSLGRFGRTVEEAAEEMLRARLREVLLEGWLNE